VVLGTSLESMRRYLFVAATAIALCVPSSLATMIVGGPAFASSSITCSKLTGFTNLTIAISRCTPRGGTGYEWLVGAAGPILSGGGPMTWEPSFALTEIGDTNVTLVLSDACKDPTGNEEISLTGTVTEASTSGTGIPAVGDTFSALICENLRNGKVKLVKGTEADL
jgi:hypothetical protein